MGKYMAQIILHEFYKKKVKMIKKSNAYWETDEYPQEWKRQ